MQVPGDDFDGRLGAALRGYADPGDEPHPAVMVARVFAAAEGSRTRGWMWAGWRVGAALACLLVIMITAVSAVRERTSRPVWREEDRRVASQGSIAVPAGVARVAPRLVARPPAAKPHMVRAKLHTLPKLEQFPQPQPLSEQEKLTLAFIAAASPADQKILAKVAEPPEFARIAELQLPVTQPSTLHAENLGVPHEEHR